MALPPEPLEDVLPAARTVVLAEVRSVDDLAAWPPGDKGGPIDGAPDRPAQRVRLIVSRVLRGAAAGEITAKKPPANYALRPGVVGAFLIDENDVILGRYGPDTYAVEEIERAL